METIIIMAQALAKAGKLKIVRLDIHYIEAEDGYVGRVWLSPYCTNNIIKFDIKENGEVEVADKKEVRKA